MLLNFENNGDVWAIYTDERPDALVARVDSEGDIHIEEDAPDWVTEEKILSELEHTLSMTLELKDIDWTPDACFMKAVGWDIEWSWDETSNSWIKKD